MLNVYLSVFHSLAMVKTTRRSNLAFILNRNWPYPMTHAITIKLSQWTAHLRNIWQM